MALAGRYFNLRNIVAVIAAALIVCAAIAGAVVLSGHRVQGAGHSCPSSASLYACTYHPRPGWVLPVAAGIVVLGLVVATGILVGARRSAR